VFHGNGFLYKMVRNITGTLVEIARGALPEERLEEFLQSPGPFHGHTAPAHGLTLIEVIY
jgi:tRNA pseudouridine38-40 synthase